jgi:membrane-bound lytic murein transglycosylase B
MPQTRTVARPTRRAVLGAGLALTLASPVAAETGFPAFIERFRARARARGVSDATYARVTSGLQPDPEVLQLSQRQAEFTESTWQYLSRRVNEWRITTGRQRLEQHRALLQAIEARYGVDRFTIVSVWGNESAYGEIFANPRVVRSTLRSLATLAWSEPRRRAYWEQEFANALLIVERGWSTPERMIGSWAGAMGHTQFMPEAWLSVAVDFDGDGRRDLYGVPDALASTAQFLKTRGRWQTGQPWGYEVSAAPSVALDRIDERRARPVRDWQRSGITRVDGRPFPDEGAEARVRFPAGRGGPGFLMFQNFRAALAYNPSFNYALAVHHLADRIRGQGPFVTPFAGASRELSLEELGEMQRRLTALGFDTGGADGRVGDMTRRAVRAFQERAGMRPADGWPSEQVLNRLRASGGQAAPGLLDNVLSRQR